MDESEGFLEDVLHELRFARVKFASTVNSLKGSVAELAGSLNDEYLIPEAGEMRGSGVLVEVDNVAGIAQKMLRYADLIEALEAKVEWGVDDEDTRVMYSMLRSLNNGYRGGEQREE